jgi:hypothetical protein
MEIDKKDFEVYERLRQDDELNTFRPTNCGLSFDKITYISRNYNAIRQDYTIQNITNDELEDLYNLEARVEEKPVVEAPVVTPVLPVVDVVTEPVVDVSEDNEAPTKLSIKERYDQCYMMILDGKSNKDIMEGMGVSNTYVYKIRKQYEKDLPTRVEMNGGVGSD